MNSIRSPYFPNYERLHRYIQAIYSSGWLTNNGPLVKELEQRLAHELDVPYLVLVANGTLAIQLAIRLLKLRGEVITTPLSFVATANALQWEQLTPRFADVDSVTFNLDPDSVEKLITPRTTAILPVHLFGHACDIEKLEHIARQYKLKIIYDAAQAFGLRQASRSILHFGDVSVLSLHATKVFHTVEGGALVFHDPRLYEAALKLRSHGRSSNQLSNPGFGINAKMSEMHAAVGHCMLDEFIDVKQHYASQRAIYIHRLSKSSMVRIPRFLDGHHDCNIYMPALFDTVKLRQAIEEKLSKLHVEFRRYFDPPLHLLEHFGSSDRCPTAESIAQRLLLLPMLATAGPAFTEKVCDAIQQVTLEPTSAAREVSPDAPYESNSFCSDAEPTSALPLSNQ